MSIENQNRPRIGVHPIREITRCKSIKGVLQVKRREDNLILFPVQLHSSYMCHQYIVGNNIWLNNGFSYNTIPKRVGAALRRKTTIVIPCS